MSVVASTTKFAPFETLPSSAISRSSGFSIVTVAEVRAPTWHSSVGSVEGAAGVPVKLSLYQNSPTRSFRNATEPPCVRATSGA